MSVRAPPSHRSPRRDIFATRVSEGTRPPSPLPSVPLLVVLPWPQLARDRQKTTEDGEPALSREVVETSRAHVANKLRRRGRGNPAVATRDAPGDPTGGARGVEPRAGCLEPRASLETRRPGPRGGAEPCREDENPDTRCLIFSIPGHQRSEDLPQDRPKHLF